MKQIVQKRNRKKVVASFFIPCMMAVTTPVGMTLNQSLVLGLLTLAILWWGSGWVHQDATSVFLIIGFMIFGETPLLDVFYFPLSANIVMVATSYLLSQGIINADIADQFSDYVLNKYCHNGTSLVITSFVLCILLIFAIPQPFPRVVLLSSTYASFLNKQSIPKESKAVLIFSVAVAASVTALMFLNGDVIANYAAIGFGGIDISSTRWMRLMTVPTIFTTIFVAAAFHFAFRKEIKVVFETTKSKEPLKIRKNGRIALAIMALVIILWYTEAWHGMDAVVVSAIGVAMMYLTTLLRTRDLKAVNVSLLLFMTAQFSVGRVLIGSGVAAKLKDYMMTFFPHEINLCDIPLMVLLIICLHMIMGSIITTLSFSIPLLVVMTEGLVSIEFIVLLACVSTYYHYILPFHQVTVMIGYGGRYFENKHVIKLGGYLTLVTIFAVFCLYMPWWKWAGLID